MQLPSERGLAKIAVILIPCGIGISVIIGAVSQPEVTQTLLAVALFSFAGALVYLFKPKKEKNKETEQQNINNHRNQIIEELSLIVQSHLEVRVFQELCYSLKNFRYVGKLIEHLYTGHKQIHDTLANYMEHYKKREKIKEELETILEKTLKEIAVKLDFALDNSNSKTPFFSRDHVIRFILNEAGTDNWKDFSVPERENPDALYLDSNGSVSYVNNVDRQKAEQLASEVNDLILQNIDKLKDFQYHKQESKKYDSEFYHLIVDLINDIEDYTEQFQGHCSKCIPLYPKKQHKKLKQQLPTGLLFD